MVENYTHMFQKLNCFKVIKYSIDQINGLYPNWLEKYKTNIHKYSGPYKKEKENFLLDKPTVTILYVFLCPSWLTAGLMSTYSNRGTHY